VVQNWSKIKYLDISDIANNNWSNTLFYKITKTNNMIIIFIGIVFLIGVFFEKSDYQRSKECNLPPFTKKEAEQYYNQNL
jgi:hypothetical protein